jgi:deoxyribodipyrimidine photo-lyase
MHNHMRMYWGKKVLEWSASPEEAFATLLRLNNRYFIDGRDANSYANVAWVFGLHDRPWPERPIFGSVRYMNAAGLERKTDVGAYVAKIAGLRSRGTPPRA